MCQDKNYFYLFWIICFVNYYFKVQNISLFKNIRLCHYSWMFIMYSSEMWCCFLDEKGDKGFYSWFSSQGTICRILFCICSAVYSYNFYFYIIIFVISKLKRNRYLWDTLAELFVQSNICLSLFILWSIVWCWFLISF